MKQESSEELLQQAADRAQKLARDLEDDLLSMQNDEGRRLIEQARDAATNLVQTIRQEQSK